MVSIFLLGENLKNLDFDFKDSRVNWTNKKIELDELKILKPDLLLSFGYRHLIQSDALQFVNYRAINCHISLLPWNRGADPNFWSWALDTPKGFSFHWINEGLDKGKILFQQEQDFPENETLKTSYDLLISTSKKLIHEIVNTAMSTSPSAIPQAGIGSYHSMKERLKLWEWFPLGWDTPCSNVREIYLEGIANSKSDIT